MVEDSSFKEKEFYTEPPNKDASVEEWNTWIAQDKLRRSAHLAVHTKSLTHAEVPDQFRDALVVKSGGVHRQGMLMGYVGSVDIANLTGDLGVNATQEHRIALADMESKRNRRGGSRKGKSARRRKNRKACVKTTGVKQ